MLGSEELILIFGIAILLFGANKLPELARSLGSSMGEFQRAQRETEISLRQYKTSDREHTATKNKIQETAEKLGVDIKDKTDDQLLDEIQKLADKPIEAIESPITVGK
jgi:sec-independent protein translocase protein TatA